MLIAFVYQKLLHGEISKKRSKIKEFSLFPNFVVKRKAFELTYDCLILYFPVVIPVQNICRKFLILTIERFDIQLTNIKISDKNIVPPGGAQGPEGGSFYCYFEVLM